MLLISVRGGTPRGAALAGEESGGETMCLITAFHEPEHTPNPAGEAGELYLEYLERQQKKKKPIQKEGTYAALQEDYFR